MRKIKWILLIVKVILFSYTGYTQFYWIEDKADMLQVEFLRKKIEVKEEESFFNALKIKNPTNTVIAFEAGFSYPADWVFMGDKNQSIVLNPNDSIIIPFRGAPAVNAKGEIGYAFVASLTDSKGNSIKNEYSFVNIPKISDLKAKLNSRIIYFDPQSNNSVIELKINNKGNTDEYVAVTYTFPQNVSAEGVQKGIFVKEMVLKPHTDTTIKQSVMLKSDRNQIDKRMHRIEVKVSTRDTTLNTSVWAKQLENTFINVIPSNYKLINIEATAQNIFSDNPIEMKYRLYGYFLPKKSGVFNYDYQTFGDTKVAEDYWYFSRIYLNYYNSSLNVEAGDLNQVIGHNLSGRGGFVDFKLLKSTNITMVATQNMFVDVVHGAFAIRQGIKKAFIELGASYEQDRVRFVNSGVGFGSISFVTKKLGSLSIYGAASMAEWQLSQTQQLGFASHLNYSYHNKKSSINIRGSLAQPEYFGNLPGRSTIMGNFRYNLSNRHRLINDFNYFNNEIPHYTDGIIDETLLTGNLRNRLVSNYDISPTLQVMAGPIYESREGNQFYGLDNAYFKSNSMFGYGQLKFRDRVTTNTLTGSITAGYNWVGNARFDNMENYALTDNWFSAIFNLSYRSRIWGFNATYYQGPYTLNQQFNYYYNGVESKNMILMPYLDMFVIPKYVRLVIRPNLTYTVVTNTSRINSNADLWIYPGRDWEFLLSNSLNYSAVKDRVSQEKTTFSASYFELRVRKSISINQPRYQYHNVKVYFFKDLNGNRVKDDNEPGVKDVLLTIEHDDEATNMMDYNTAAHFLSIELLSDMNGYIAYQNLPNGFYVFDYRPISNIEGAYTTENSNQKVYVDKNVTLYIPFNENNKIFGKAIINRSKLSNLGNIEPSNIKVTAEDSRGKKYSTLTDRYGNYTLYVPNIDNYKVRINNIYFENFELEQNDYSVQLNGYKMFEVNFIFNEKRRKINFASTYEYGTTAEDQGIEIIRRTNLSGTVKDATTLLPVNATIRVVDRGGNEITSTQSNLKTGVFALSFVAGDDYTVEVNAEDYWFSAEKLYSEQIVTFKNLRKEILLKAITVGQNIPMKTLNFDPGSYEIPVTSFPELERLMNVLKKNPTVKISVHGHADDLEILDSQADLALERAKMVAKYLIANGYNRVKYSGHANTKPMAENDTEDGRKQNRRVEIVVTGK